MELRAAVVSRTDFSTDLPEPDKNVFDYSASPTWPGLAGEFRQGREIHLAERTHFLPMESPREVADLILAELRGANVA